MPALREDGQFHISPELYARKLHLENQQLARLAGVHRNTVRRVPHSPRLQEFLRESVRVLAAATDFTGDFGRAVFWFRNQPIGALDYKTPEVLVSEGRTEQVLRYIDTLEAGTA